MKECYYSVLGVERKADEESIKRAYRQLALKFHPDKQPEEQREAATARFQVIVEAYECLSDRNERAWYDDHRTQILGGAEGCQGGSGEISSKKDIWKYYSSSCFNGRFDDSQGGFFRIYADLFEELASLEKEDFDSDSESDHFSTLPSFGDSKSEWEDVQCFYSHWTNFQTSRRFRAYDKWDLREGGNRQVRRAMEVENKKARNSARKEYSSAVRNLVAFVKRRDRRVIEYQAKLAEQEREIKEGKEKALRIRDEQKKQAREVAREEEMRRWEMVEKMKIESGAVSSGSSQESADESEVFFCVACRKTFKSDRAYTNHENSKKHKQEVERLRQELLLDDEIAENEQGHDVSVCDSPVTEPKEKKKKTKKKKSVQVDFSDDEPSIRAPALQIQEVSEALQSPTQKPVRRRRAAKEPNEGQTKLNACKKCGESFQSKSALFRHLDSSGHHALVSELQSKSKR
jgi:DnaJ family protein A protein 5